MAPDITVDCSGSFCPAPIIEVARALASAPRGSLVLLLATDPGIEPDIQAFCAVTGHGLERFEARDGTFRAWVRKAGG